MQVAALIGDVVGSRRSPDRVGLQRDLIGVLEEVSRRDGSALAVTLGDEFQGRYPTLQAAVSASWHLHLGTASFARLRIGIGWGAITVDPGEDSPFGQDGPAWWRARDAIESLARVSHPGRTVISTETKWDDLMNAHLTLRDMQLEKLDAKDIVILRGLVDGVTQRQLADRLELHESSVSRRVTRHQLTALAEAATPAIPGP